MTAAGVGRCLLMLVSLVLAAERQAGEKMYMGDTALRGKLGGADDDLDPEATRCVNCHGPDGRGVAEGELASTDIRGRILARPTLRRGGPASRYDGKGFCVALRLGQDPAGVVLDRGMPRFRISNEECAALWRFLESMPLKTEDTQGKSADAAR